MSASIEGLEAAKGWTLRQAQERTADPALWDAFLAAAAELKRIQSTLGPQWSKSRYRAPAELSAEQAKSAAWEKIKNHVVELLSAEKLGSVGSRGGPSVQPSPIHYEGSRSLRIINYEKSIVRERTPSMDKIYNVRVFPVIHSLDAAAQLSGCSLGKAFRRCVLDDPELIAAAKRIPDRQQYEAIFNDGQFPGPYVEFYWSLDMPAADMAFQFVREVALYSGLPELPPSIQHVANILTDRLQGLRERLTKGELVARGTFSATGEVQYVEPLQWERPRMWIEIRGSDLVEEQGDKKVALWTGLTLFDSKQIAVGMAAHTSAYHTKPAAYGEIRPTTARATRKSTANALGRKTARKECTSWLEELMRASPNEKKEIKSALFKKTQEKWPGISERIFNSAWADAVDNTDAMAWTAPGAPKKSGK